MSVRRSSALVALVVSLALGCARGSGGDAPTPQTPRDAGPGFDAGAVVGTDAGTTPIGDDAGTTPIGDDAGTTPVETDAGTPGTDSGVIGIDAGRDSGAPMVDAGTDAGPIGTDAGPPCTPLPTGTTQYTGSTSGGATFDRPNGTSCPTGSTAAGRRYATHTFCNTGGAASFDFAVTAGSFDGFLVVYSGASVPSDTRQCMGLNDDDALGLGTDPYIEGLSVGAGQQITVVVTGYDPGDAGNYTLYVQRF